MKLALLGRPGEVTSGGDLYDLELARELRLRGHEVSAWVHPDTEVTLVDGILFREWRPEGAARNVGLIHVPASFLDDDPKLPALEQAFFDRLDAVQFVSELVRRDTAARFRLPVRQWVVEPGVGAARAGERNADVLIVGVGAALPHKRVREAMEVFAALADVPGWRGEWLGDLELAPDYSKTLQPPSQVTLRGHVSHDEVQHTLAHAAALLTMSPYESWGFAAAEALQSGVPVIGGTESGLALYLGGAGHLNVEGPALIDALRKLIEEPARRARLQLEARRAAARLPGWARCADLTATRLHSGLS